MTVLTLILAGVGAVALIVLLIFAVMTARAAEAVFHGD